MSSTVVKVPLLQNGTRVIVEVHIWQNRCWIQDENGSTIVTFQPVVKDDVRVLQAFVHDPANFYEPLCVAKWPQGPVSKD